MPIIEKKSKFLLLFCLFLFLLGGIIHASKYRVMCIIEFSSFYTFYYSSIVITWIISVSKRIINREVRNHLILIGFLLMFWFFLQTIKFTPITNQDLPQRMIWYLYYIPIILIPLFSFLAALYVGREKSRLNDYSKISKVTKFLYVFSVLLILCVLTNERHHLFFQFHEPFENWKKNYSYGFMYFVSIVWCALLCFLTIGEIINKCRILKSRKYAYLLLIPIAAGIAFLVPYALKMRHLFYLRMYRMSEIVAFMVILSWELCIKIGLIPSNSSYSRFFRHSAIPAQIVDRQGNVVYCSENMLYEEERFLNSSDDLNLCNEDTRISSKELDGGFIFWKEDLSDINMLNRELNEINRSLQVEYDFIRAENEILKRKKKNVERANLYDEISKSVNEQVDYISECLVEMEAMEEHDFRVLLARLCIFESYIKRRSNLTLLSHKNEFMPIYELENSIRESLEYVNLYGVSAYIHGSCHEMEMRELDISGSLARKVDFIHYANMQPDEENKEELQIPHNAESKELITRLNYEDVLPSRTILFLYDFFEQLLEASLIDMNAILVNLECGHEEVILRMNLEGVKANKSTWRSKEASDLNIEIGVYQEDETAYWKLSVAR